MENNLKKKNVPVAERIKLLIGPHRSVREAAEDWGVNPETIRNYFKRKDSKPRFEVLQKISNAESVSIDWILSGVGQGPASGSNELNSNDCYNDKLNSILNVLTRCERDALADILLRKGAETLLYLLDENNIALLQQPDVVKAHVLEKYLTAHVAAIDTVPDTVPACADETPTSPQSKA